MNDSIETRWGLFKDHDKEHGGPLVLRQLEVDSDASGNDDFLGETCDYEDPTLAADFLRSEHYPEIEEHCGEIDAAESYSVLDDDPDDDESEFEMVVPEAHEIPVIRLSSADTEVAA